MYGADQHWYLDFRSRHFAQASHPACVTVKGTGSPWNVVKDFMHSSSSSSSLLLLLLKKKKKS